MITSVLLLKSLFTYSRLLNTYQFQKSLIKVPQKDCVGVHSNCKAVLKWAPLQQCIEGRFNNASWDCIESTSRFTLMVYVIPCQADNDSLYVFADDNIHFVKSIFFCLKTSFCKKVMMPVK